MENIYLSMINISKIDRHTDNIEYILNQTSKHRPEANKQILATLKIGKPEILQPLKLASLEFGNPFQSKT